MSEYCPSCRRKLDGGCRCKVEPVLDADATRASAVRYLRAMAESLYHHAREADEASNADVALRLRRDGAMAESLANDLEQRLDLDPERLRELGVTG